MAMALRASVAVGGRFSSDRSLSSNFVSAPGAAAESVALGRQLFLGCTQSLRCFVPPNCRSVPNGKRLLTTAVIKRQKDYKLDAVIQGEKKLKRVQKIKDILVKQPGQVMSLRDLGKFRRQLGLDGKKKVIALLRKFPAVFEVYEEGCTAKYFRFTPVAKKQYREEARLKKEVEDVAVTRLRKLLMMSVDKSIAIQKIKHIRRDLGLPDDFDKSDFLSRHSQYFKVGTCALGPLLILEEWDPALAVTALEKAAQEKVRARQELEEELARSLGEEIEEEESLLARTPRFQSKKTLNLPKGQQVKKADRLRLLKFQELPSISPYADKTDLDRASPVAEKAAVLVVHELLSLTSEKKILVDHLTHFRSDFKFSQRIRSMLIRHPEYFYVSLKGTRDSVFLREAYQDSELKEKDVLVLLKERLLELVKNEKLDEVSDGDEDDDDEVGDDNWDDDDDDDDDNLVGVAGMASVQPQKWQVPTAPKERW